LASSKIVFSSSCRIFTLALHSSTSTMLGCTACIIWNKNDISHVMQWTVHSHVFQNLTISHHQMVNRLIWRWHSCGSYIHNIGHNKIRCFQVT
jgi:hypothetical protein